MYICYLYKIYIYDDTIKIMISQALQNIECFTWIRKITFASGTEAPYQAFVLPTNTCYLRRVLHHHFRVFCQMLAKIQRKLRRDVQEVRPGVGPISRVPFPAAVEAEYSMLPIGMLLVLSIILPIWSHPYTGRLLYFWLDYSRLALYT